MKIKLTTYLKDSYEINATRIDFSQSQLRIEESDKHNSFWFFPVSSIISFEVFI